ncbi:hypothetical protein EP7_003420 [Isosphaeraceae bacterium EP7]
MKMGIVRLAIICSGIAVIPFAMSKYASASTLNNQYMSYGHIDYPSRVSDMVMWSSNIGGSNEDDWAQEQVPLGWVNRSSVGSYPTPVGPIAVYDHVPFSFSIFPRIGAPSSPPGYHYDYTVTGPASDGVLIRGHLNGTFWNDGTSDVLATYEPPTPFDIAKRFREDLHIPYIVDPNLPNPFPIDRLILPESVKVNASGYTVFYASLRPDPVPEPAVIVAFVPLALILAYRRWSRVSPRQAC